jgi:hypothetical protein
VRLFPFPAVKAEANLVFLKGAASPFFFGRLLATQAFHRTTQGLNN